MKQQTDNFYDDHLEFLLLNESWLTSAVLYSANDNAVLFLLQALQHWHRILVFSVKEWQCSFRYRHLHFVMIHLHF